MFFEDCIIAFMNLVCGLFIMISAIVIFIMLLKSDQGKSHFDEKNHLDWVRDSIKRKRSYVENSSLSSEKKKEWYDTLDNEEHFLETEYKKI